MERTILPRFRLERQEGRSEHPRRDHHGVRRGRRRGARRTAAGPACEEALRDSGIAHRVVARETLPDEAEQVARAVRVQADADEADLIVLTGGTGVSPRDRTPEGVREVIEFEVPGLAEKMRAETSRGVPGGVPLAAGRRRARQDARRRAARLAEGRGRLPAPRSWASFPTRSRSSGCAATSGTLPRPRARSAPDEQSPLRNRRAPGEPVARRRQAHRPDHECVGHDLRGRADVEGAARGGERAAGAPLRPRARLAGRRRSTWRPSARRSTRRRACRSSRSTAATPRA